MPRTSEAAAPIRSGVADSPFWKPRIAAYFRASCAAVLERKDLAEILQLGSPSGFEPLRRRLLDEARQQGLLAPGDDLRSDRLQRRAAFRA